MSDRASGHAAATGAPQGRRASRSVAVGALTGAGLMGAVDEIVFHQLLRWHHLYDRSTPTWALVSDGLLHTATLAAVVIGLLLLSGLRGTGAFEPRMWGGGLLLGLGGFQLFDGLVNHKLLRLHQIRDGVDLLPYDLAWNGAAALLIVAGLAVLRRRDGGSASG